ncbi:MULTISPECIES: DUF3168 domain-containing protein [Rhizobium/Agrobacterium group]|uniref:DUF3168 domain-containing protein n=1 Tax=Rhizobium/Agrobacterium group TaxID=227290 RepID=UPI0007125CE1|nr:MULTISPECIES: DUF3168 domain-containing protein [Rhizobium/Agrobacterium group]KQQ58605.1 hypothetical protein ASF69_14625 [Rhizobium sp. Leaf311]
MKAANALLQAIHARLASDAALVAMVGDRGIVDRLLPRPVLPCVVFGDMESRQLSADTPPGEEHLLTIEVWSAAGGRKMAQDIALRVLTLLDDAPLVLSGNIALVSLFYRSSRSVRETKSKPFLTEIRFRAITE